MEADGLRQRDKHASSTKANGNVAKPTSNPHPSGRKEPSVFSQTVRATLFTSYFTLCCVAAHLTQLVGAWLYFVNKNYYYAYMALTKQSFGILLASGTQWFSPTSVRISGDGSVEGQLKLTKDGRLETNFPERLLMIANHQLYPEWAYLWWIAYTSRMHGHIYIILKESLKYIPVIGPGMIFYGFIFMARNWAKDQSRMEHRLRKLASRHDGSMAGSQTLDPMWLLIFPEGTNLSANTRNSSTKWAKKNGIPDLKYQLIPRTTGLQYSLTQLKGTVDWVYDCTLAYEGIPPDSFAQDYYTLRSTYFQGRPPRVNMYWRRFAASSIPIDEPKAFEQWLLKVWKEKDALLDYFNEHGKFPASGNAVKDEKSVPGKTVRSSRQDGYIETEVKLAHWIEVGQIFVILGAIALLINIGIKVFGLMSKTSLASKQ